MTGWNLPPGCSVRDIDNAMGSDAPCDVCGLFADDCICPECPTCHTHGDPKCYEEHGLVRTKAQIDSFAEQKAQWEASNAAENRAYEQAWLDDNYYECVVNGDIANAIGWASRTPYY